MNSTIKPSLAVATLAILAGCASAARAPAAAPPSTAPVVAAASVNPQVLLLGEVHDNVQGHKLRYELLRQPASIRWRSSS